MDIGFPDLMKKAKGKTLVKLIQTIALSVLPEYSESKANLERMLLGIYHDLSKGDQRHVRNLLERNICENESIL